MIDGLKATSAAPGPGCRGVDLRAAGEGHRAARQGGDGVGQGPGRLAVVDRHPGPGVDQEAGQGDPGPGEAEHRRRQAAQRPGLDGGQGQGVEIEPSGHPHTSLWSVARKSVIPRSPASTATIQKRRVIFVSGQPPSSKWWWSGDIRRIRFPPVSLK